VSKKYYGDAEKREYQSQAIDRICEGLTDGGRGQLIAACGTGKTRIAIRSAQRLVNVGDVVVVVVPTVGLVAQTLREWRAIHPSHVAMAVCGDMTISASIQNPAPTAVSATPDEADDYLTTDVLGTLGNVTTDSDTVDAWLRRHATAPLRLIVGTHVSAHVIGAGLQKARVRAALMVIDEAHRSAGRRDKRAVTLHDDDVIPADRRLYSTATPRIYTGENYQSVALGMDNERVFGPVLFNYPFSQAIDDGWLDDYRLLVVGVTKAEVLALLRNVGERIRPNGPMPPEHLAMVQAAVARAAAKLDLRRILAFCPRISDAKSFTESLPSMIGVMAPDTRPACPINSVHVNGTMSQATRRVALDSLATPPDDGWTVLTNSRCLAEGVDVPAVDAVVFSAPKKSPEEIVQAIGRALRRHPDGSGIATIIVPIVLSATPDDGDDYVDVSIGDSGLGEFSLLWQVASALRAHDDRFNAALSPSRAEAYARGATMANVEVLLPEAWDAPQFLQDLSVHLVKTTNSGTWWTFYKHLVETKKREGNVDLKFDYVTPDGVRLGAFLARARRAHRLGLLPRDRVQALLDVGVDFRGRWWKRMDLLADFKNREGHVRVPDSYVVNGVPLGKWLYTARKAYWRGKLAPDRESALRELGVDLDARIFAWHDRLQQLVEYRSETGRNVPPGAWRTPDGFSLAKWVQEQRSQHRTGKLKPDRSAALRAAGVELPDTPTDQNAQWSRCFAVAERFHREHGHLRPAPGTVIDDVDLSTWLYRQRTRYSQGKLADDRVRRLNELGMVWRLQARRLRDDLPHWLDLLQKFHADNGRLPTTGDDADLVECVHKIRRGGRQGDLDAATVAAMDKLGMVWNLYSEERAAEWWAGYRHLEQFYRRFGHAVVDRRLVTDSGFPLGDWSTRTRTRWRTGHLPPDQVAALKEVEFPYDFRDAMWDLVYGMVERYMATHQTSDVPLGYVEQGVNLRKWLNAQRTAKKQGWLGEDRERRLAQIGIDLGLRVAPSLSEEEWLVLLREFHDAHGHLPSQSEDQRLGSKLSRMRASRERGELAQSTVAALDELGMTWNPKDESWNRGLASARRFHSKYGHLDVRPSDPPDAEDPEFNLHKWIGQMRAYRADGLFVDDRRAALLDDLGMIWALRPFLWDMAYRACVDWVGLTGSLKNISNHYVVNRRGERIDLRAWLGAQRAARHKLSQEQRAKLDAIGINWSPEG
jgi:superfamily II DNA or RNA helicase